MAEALRDYWSLIEDNHRWQRFRCRPGDIVVMTPPKCGTTWMQTIVVSLLFPAGDAPAPVLTLAPWIEMRLAPLAEMIAGLEEQTPRRWIKSHTGAHRIPRSEDARYIVEGRDGRDACMLFVNHMASLRPDVVGQLARSELEEGIDLGGGPPPSPDDIHTLFADWVTRASCFDFLPAWSAKRDEPNARSVHPDDMKADLDGTMRGVAAFFGIAIDEAM